MYILTGDSSYIIMIKVLKPRTIYFITLLSTIKLNDELTVIFLNVHSEDKGRVMYDCIVLKIIVLSQLV